MSGRTGIEDRLRSLRRAAPSPDLRDRILRAAGDTPFERSALVERIWASEALRWSWAVAFVVLIVANLTAGAGGRPRPDVAATGALESGVARLTPQDRTLIEGELRVEAPLLGLLALRLEAQREADAREQIRLADAETTF